MVIGIPKEIKNNENRVSMTPAGVYSLVNEGHTVIVQTSAGEGSGFADGEYTEAGAKIVDSANVVWESADMIVKVKEPIKSEYCYFKKGLILFTYLHLAPNQSLTKELIENEVVGIAYETVEDINKRLPLLAPMSEVAGRMSVQIGAGLLQKNNSGSGVLLGGVSGVLPAEVVIAGGGSVGYNAARMAAGLGARVTVLDINHSRMAYIGESSNGSINTLYSNEFNIRESLKKADLFISGILLPGAKAPRIVSEEVVKEMKDGSVIVDVAIDQGGSVETIDKITTHDDPYYVKHGVVHYSVANMPGAVPRTSTFALSGVTLPYIQKIARLGYVEALRLDKGFLAGLNTCEGHCTYKAVADSMGLRYMKPEDVLNKSLVKAS